MASITSLMNSNYNTSSIYGNRNILSGLASGMDTETMIENAVSGIKRKIQSLYQKRTKVEWQQEAYRSIIDKAVNLSNKYTSYTSKTNLLSSSFFNNAVITTVNGTYANKVSASGKTSSDIKINAVKQLATAATYSVSGSAAFGGDVSAITGGSAVDLAETTKVGTISGILSLQYGGSNGTSFDLNFDETDVYDNAEDLAQAIRDKLAEQTWTRTSNGVQETKAGNDVIDVQVDGDGNITFSDKLNEGNSVYISSAVGDIKSTLDVSAGEGENTLEVGSTRMYKEVKARDNLYGKTLTLNLNGTSKSINLTNVMGRINYSAEDINDEFVNALQAEIDSAFGGGKVEVSQGEDGKLSFKAKEAGSTLVLSGNATGALGFENGDANYINTSKTLKDLLGEDSDLLANNRLRGTFRNYDAKPTQKTTSDGEVYYVDDAGNRVDENGYRITNTNEYIYDFKINGASIQVAGDTTLEGLMNSINSSAEAGVKVSYSKLTNEFKFTASETGSNSRIEFGGLAKAMFNPSSSVKSTDKFSDAYDLNLQDGEKKWIHFEADGKEFTSFSIGAGGLVSGDASIQDVIKEINDNPMRYTASYDEQSGKITLTDRNGNPMELTVKISSDMGGTENVDKVESKFTGGTYTAGTDAVMDVEVNGVRFENLSRSSNVFDIDGMSITVKGTFDETTFKPENGEDYEPITFETTTDTDKIIDAIRSFVNDYNEMVTELKGAYSTQPAYKSGKERYEPLTAEEEEGYTESQLAAYNEKAKQGILFGDTTLSSMYSKLLNAIAPGGTDGQALREIGIGTSYENGLTTLSLNEDKLRAALDSDPDKVKNAFTKTKEGGASSDGLMQTMQNTLNTYVSTVGEPKGVLITRAGSVKAPTSLGNNSLQTQINNIDKEVNRWQNKMSSQIDRYTKQFSKLEQLVAAMNSQASALAGLMGGYEGY